MAKKNKHLEYMRRKEAWAEKPSKYQNETVYMDGERFDSRKEARRYWELTLLQRAGQIADLRRQVKYILIPTQREPAKPGSRIPGKVIERECAYYADFVYTDKETGKTVVEDTKGMRTKDYIIKRKLMLERFGIRIREV